VARQAAEEAQTEDRGEEEACRPEEAVGREEAGREEEVAVTTLSLVVAMAENGVIGRAGALPWHLPDDLRHFKAVTLGKPVLMGRRTFESIGRPLPGRRNIVLSGGAPIAIAGIETLPTLAAALAACGEVAEVCVIGGAGLYAAALPLAHRLHLTQVHGLVTGDVHFPAMNWEDWRETGRSEHPADDRHAWAMTFLTLDRIA
jgi:dihydrofolate reductase